MAPKREKPPTPIVRWAGGKLSPVTSFDAQELDTFPQGMMFDMTPRSKRTLPLHRSYWMALTRAVEATGRWESREALHTAMKVKMGLVEPLFGLDGKVIGMVPHSTAFAAMDQTAFKAYFDKSMAALADAVGYDVLAFLDA